MTTEQYIKDNGTTTQGYMTAQILSDAVAYHRYAVTGEDKGFKSTSKDMQIAIDFLEEAIALMREDLKELEAGDETEEHC